jgi:hypothetical protein
MYAFFPFLPPLSLPPSLPPSLPFFFNPCVFPLYALHSCLHSTSASLLTSPSTPASPIPLRLLQVSQVRIMTLDEADQLLDAKNKIDCERIRG